MTMNTATLSDSSDCTLFIIWFILSTSSDMTGWLKMYSIVYILSNSALNYSAYFLVIYDIY